MAALPGSAEDLTRGQGGQAGCEVVCRAGDAAQQPRPGGRTGSCPPALSASEAELELYD